MMSKSLYLGAADHDLGPIPAAPIAIIYIAILAPQPARRGAVPDIPRPRVPGVVGRPL